MDGLLIDSERLVRAAMQRAAAELGYELSDGFFASLIGHARDESDRRFLAHFGPGFPLEELSTRRRAYFWEAVEHGRLAIRPGAAELLAVLRQRGMACAVATSTRREAAKMCLQRTGLWDYVQVLAAGDEVAVCKPAPDLYLLAASRLKLPAGDCLAVEDSDTGALAARRAGMTVMVVPDLLQLSDETRKAAYAVLNSLSEVLPLLNHRG